MICLMSWTLLVEKTGSAFCMALCCPSRKHSVPYLGLTSVCVYVCAAHSAVGGGWWDVFTVAVVVLVVAAAKVLYSSCILASRQWFWLVLAPPIWTVSQGLEPPFSAERGGAADAHKLDSGTSLDVVYVNKTHASRMLLILTSKFPYCSDVGLLVGKLEIAPN